MSTLPLLRRLMAVWLLPLVLVQSVHGSAAASDSGAAADDFVTAWLLIASPGRNVHQALGHAALRLQCPSAGLDKVFSFETDMNGGIIGQFIGEAHGRMCSVDAEEYIGQFLDEGRGITAYRLNLTPRQRQELWRAADNMLVVGRGRFNIRYKSCMSEALRAISRAVEPARISADSSEELLKINGEFIDPVLDGRSPWSKLMIKNAISSDCDVTDAMMTRLWPLAFQKEYPHMEIVSPDGTSRPLVDGPPVELAEAVVPDVPRPFTPYMAAWSVVALVVAATGLQLMRGAASVVVRVIDFLLLAMVTAIGCFLIFINYMPNHVGGVWNWNIIVFNPLPAIFMAIFGRRSFFHYFYMAYAVVLGIFAVSATFVTSGVDGPVCLVAGALCLRSLAKGVLASSPD